MAGPASPAQPASSSSPTLGSTLFPRRRKKLTIPRKTCPIGILGSLVICTVLYILVSGLLTGIVPYADLNVSDPVALGIDATGVAWARFLVKLGAIFGLATVMLVMLLGQSRVFYSMSRDGLLPEWAGAVHPRFRTPWISTLLVGGFVAIFAAVIPIDILGELVSIGTLLAFVIVCFGVWILRNAGLICIGPSKHRWCRWCRSSASLSPSG